MKKFVSLLLALMMALSLVACGSKADTKTDDKTDDDTVTEPANALEKIKADGVLTVALSPDFSPMEFVDSSKTGQDQYVGFDITLAKHMTNMRSATADVLETLTPPIKMSLEESLDFANEDECVEVTPESIRVRKIILSREDWYKWRAKQRRQNNAQNNK